MYFENEKKFKLYSTIFEAICIAALLVGGVGCFYSAIRIFDEIGPLWAAILDAILFSVSGIALTGSAIIFMVFMKDLDASLRKESIIGSEDSEEA